ncbi:MAG TPA: HEAT repeat domain-containing protein [Acidobacteriota bacterium]|nr:HEAT repeat domain-containing protein [Acidobacteriota bacterium]
MRKLICLRATLAAILISRFCVGAENQTPLGVLEKALAHSNSAIRLRAVEGMEPVIERVTDPASLAALLSRAVRDKSTPVRQQAITPLALVDRDAFVAVLPDFLGKGDEIMELWAARALERVSAPAAKLEELIPIAERLLESDGLVTMNAGMSLSLTILKGLDPDSTAGLRHSQWVMESLLSRHPDRAIGVMVRSGAIAFRQKLSELENDPGLSPIITLSRCTVGIRSGCEQLAASISGSAAAQRGDLLGHLLWLPKEAEPGLSPAVRTVLAGAARDALSSQNSGMRITGLVMLEKMKSPDAKALAIALLADPDSRVRLQAALMLPDTADHRIRPIIENSFRSENLRGLATSGVAERGRVEYAMQIAQTLESDAGTGVKREALRQLAKLKATGPVSHLITQSFWKPGLEYHAAMAMVAVMGESALAFFREVLTTEKEVVPVKRTKTYARTPEGSREFDRDAQKFYGPWERRIAAAKAIMMLEGRVSE